MDTRSTSRRRIGVLAAAGLAVASIIAVPADAYVGLGFELDGDTADASGIAADDWNTLYGGGGSALEFTGIVADPTGETIFTGGSTKDDLEILNPDGTGWLWSEGSVPDKDEITNAYAAAYMDDGDLIIYFGADRYAVNGNANLGFWFLQNEVSPVGLDDEGVTGGGFSDSHEYGDILVLSEFTNGGTVPTIDVYKWVGTGGEINGTLTSLFTGAGEPGPCDPDSPQDACAAVNPGAIQVPWPYQAKGGKFAYQTVPPGGFFEGGINLTELIGEAGVTPCISNFIAETRSSASVDAVLKDFAFGDFDLCGADIAIGTDATNEVGDPHTFTVSVSQVFGGASYPAPDGTDVDVTLTSSNGAAHEITENTCDTDAGGAGTQSGSCTVTFTSPSAGKVTGTATATVAVGDTTVTVSTNGSNGNSGPAVKTFVDARISIGPDDVNGIGESHTFTVLVEKNLGDNSWVAATEGNVDVTLTDPASSSYQLDADASTCDDAQPDGDNLDSNGQCALVFTSMAETTFTANADVTLSVGGVTLMRATAAGGDAFDDPATKEFVDGSLSWLKHDDQGQLLGGATFYVCRTHDFVSTDASYTELTTPVCWTVVDHVGDAAYEGKDEDGDAGEFLLSGLVLGRYTIDETAAPTGYAMDPTTHTENLSLDASDVASSYTFVNPALYKMIILTCNTTTEELVESLVTLEGFDPATTLGELPDGFAATMADVCGLGGASYDDLLGGTYVPSVTIPRPVPEP